MCTLLVHLSLFLPVYPSVFLPAHLPICLYVRLSVCIYECPSNLLTVHLSINQYVFIHETLCAFISLSLSIHLFVYLFILLSICLSVHLSVCIYECPSNLLTVSPSVKQPVYTYMKLSVQSSCPFISISVCLSICSFVHLSIYLYLLMFHF